MATIRRLFDRQSNPPVREISQEEKNARAGFALDIHARITVWSQPGYFDYDERLVLGGMPGLRSTDYLAKVFYDFLEAQRSKKEPGRRDMMDRLLETVAGKDFLFHPLLGLNNSRLELSSSARLLTAAILDKLLEGKHYRDMKTPEVCAGIADFILKEGRNFLYCYDGMTEHSAGFDESIKAFSNKILVRDRVEAEVREASAARQIMLALASRERKTGTVHILTPQ